MMVIEVLSVLQFEALALLVVQDRSFGVVIDDSVTEDLDSLKLED